MRKYFLVTLLLLFWSSSSLLKAQNKAEALAQDTTLSKPQITFVNQEYDFGKVRKNERVSTSFYFKNTGTRPLQILQVQASCGCTVSEWSKVPIAANAVGEITVIFSPDYQEGIQGMQEKALLVISNALNKEVVLALKGEIVKAEQ